MSRSVSSSVFGVCGALAIALAACGGGGDDDGGGGRVDGPPFADSAPTVDGTPGADANDNDAPPANACASPPAFAVGTASTGTTVGHGPSAFEGGCASLDGSGAEATFSFTAPSSGTLELTMLSPVDLGLSVATACGDGTTELACADAEFGGDPEVLTLDVVSGTTYYVVVDGFSPTDEGTFELTGRLVDYAGLCGAASATLGTGTTVGGTLEFEGFCTGRGAPSALYTYTPGVAGESGDMTITLTSAADLGVFARTTCADASTEVLCADTQLGGTNEVLRVPVQGGTAMTLFVDGFVPGAQGPFTLDVTYSAASCGNGVKEGLEACDAPGLPTATCSATCTSITPPLPTTETECTHLGDEDGDGSVDCRDIDCAAGCTPGAGALATACDAASDCSAIGNDPACLDEAFFGWPSGHCSQFCDPADGAECGVGNVCVGISSADPTLGLCFKACATPATDCPSAGYVCRTITSAGADVCWSGCTADAQCPGVGHCDVASGFCNPVETCGNALDDDLDGDADCLDPDCAGQGACAALTEVEPNDTSATANVYAAGFHGAIGTAGDLDWVAVTVPGPSSTLVAKVTDGGTGACAALSIDTYVELYGPDGMTQLAANEDTSNDNYCSRTGMSGLAAGTYYVVVESSPVYAAEDTLTYGLEVTVVP